MGACDQHLGGRRIHAGKVDLELATFPIETLVRDVASTVGPSAQKNGNRVEVRCAPDVDRKSTRLNSSHPQLDRKSVV